jgi:putative transposase
LSELWEAFTFRPFSASEHVKVFTVSLRGQFILAALVRQLQEAEIKISWSGRKRCYDNILAERLWRTLKYEEVYLRAYNDGWDAEVSLARFLWRYGHVRPHSSLGGRTPHAVYSKTQPCSSRPELTISGAEAVQ